MSELTVVQTTDFSGSQLDDVSLIGFVNPAGTLARALFADQQVAPGPIRSDAAIDGSAGRNEIVITGNSIAVGLWTFTNWLADDAITINGTASFDEVFGSQERDRISGFADNDFLIGLGGADRILGGAGEDLMQGNEGDDILRGGAGNDHLQGDEGSNVLSGGAGDDTIVTLTPEGGDRIDGGAGFDGLEFIALGSADIVIDIRDGGAGRDAGNGTVIANMERVSYDGFSGGGDDRIVGGAGDDDFFGGAGNDHLRGTGGDDAIRGGGGRNLLAGGKGGDLLLSTTADGADRIRGGAGVDTASLHRGDATDYAIDVSDGGGGRDIGDGTSLSSIEVLEFFGGGGDDLVQGGAGADILSGGGGDDVLSGGGGNDAFVFTSATGSGACTIADFSPGADSIDLSRIDARPGLPGNSFDFIGAAAFSQVAGELRYFHEGEATVIEADLTGDGQADFRFELASVIDVVAGDFVL